jgi:glyoxylate reductase
MRIFVSQPVAAAVVAELSAAHHVMLWPGPYPVPPRALPDALVGAEGALTMLTDHLGPSILQEAPRLRMVANMAVGFDNIDVKTATGLGILVTNTPDVLTEATAEFTWTLILALARGLIPARDALYGGAWTHWAPDGFLGRELVGKTLGIVGLGRIGRAVARRAEGFGMNVVGLGHRGQGPYPRLPQDEFLARADVVSLHVPLSADTRSLADGPFFAAMKPGAFFINTARGGLVDETALLAALERGHLAGAALDVFQQEPIDGRHPLAAHPRVLVTPHMASATVETRTAMARRAARNLMAGLAGERPPDLVNPEAFPGRAGEGFGPAITKS